jgi:hypothetical protein
MILAAAAIAVLSIAVWSLLPQPTVAQGAVGGAAAFSCADSEATIAATSAARVSAGGTTIYAGYQQVSGLNQDPIVRAFGAANWCRTDYEQTNDDGRAYGLWWDGSTLYAVFSQTGTQPGPNYSRFTGGGWITGYGAGGGPRVAIVLQLNPADGSPVGGTYLIARRPSDGNTNSLTVTSLAYTGGSLLVGATTAYSPLNIDRSPMACSGPSGFAYTVELSASLSTAVGAAAGNCISASPAPSFTLGGGGGVFGGQGINDGRLNALDLGAPAAIYCSVTGIDVYSVDPTTSEGYLAFRATISEIRAGISTATAPGGVNTAIRSGDGATLYALTSNELQVNKVYPRQPGVLYVFIFHVTACDSFWSHTSTSATGSSAATSAPAYTGPAFIYTVRAGDTLYNIARRYGLRWTDLAAINGLSAPYTIYIGQQLYIPET